MKKLVTILLLISTLLAVSQEYEPFITTSKKLFVKSNVPVDSTFSLAFDIIANQGDNTIYYNYMGLNDYYIVSDSCPFWGSPECIEQNKPLWLGPHIVSDNEGNYLFFNENGDTLNFDFNSLPSDSSLFYSDSLQNFYLVFEGFDTTTVLGYEDSAKFFRIAHADEFGNTINSELNNEKVVIGKETGLISFFVINQFPQVLQPMELIGNGMPDLGMSKITKANLYDFQAGDEIQYQNVHTEYGAPPWENYERYKKYTYLNRTDTQDSVIYKVARSSFEVGVDTLVLDTIFIKYSVNDIFAEIPFDKIEHDWNMIEKTLTLKDFCGLKLWTYTIVPEYLTYCESSICWGSSDIPGPPPNEQTTYVCGLGLYYDKSALSVPPPDISYFYLNRIIYFKKNGVVCGDEVMVGINDPKALKSNYSVYPNPAGEFLMIENSLEINGTAIFYNLNGQALMKKNLSGAVTKINIAPLSPGIYFVKIDNGKTVEVKKFVKE